MDFLRRLFSGGTPADDALHLYIKCGKCGAPVHVRVNLQHDLVADYGDTEAEGYQLIKEVMDDRCFRLMRVEMSFDARRNEESRTITGGEFISQEEYEALRAA
jgi:xanthine/CO dehydrogenase XdhC/CoxF family maturation factor